MWRTDRREAGVDVGGRGKSNYWSPEERGNTCTLGSFEHEQKVESMGLKVD